ncbi:50S ribosomal protein L18 [Candidatus Pacearchaeota archaeon]|nr:50S ribosomal protein L18 [Candidatus Pacearchaeota archaeon]
MRTVRKRRNENKTDYKLRIGLLKHGKPRIVIRKTNKYLTAQYVQSQNAKDKVLISVTSKDLVKHGWPKELSGSLKSIPAAYLTGYILGKKIIDKYKESGSILDTGLYRNIHGSRIYALVKGIIDSGVSIPHNEKIFPSEDRLNGKNMKKDISNLVKKIKESQK